MEKDRSVSGGITFTGLLQIVFIVLKLCGVLGWSWWIVLLPLEVEAVLLVIVLVFILAEQLFLEKLKKGGKS